MLTLAMVLGMLGYGCGYEGCEDGKVYVGVYTPQSEYGFVIKNSEIYLDTVYTVE